jgi:hypothetical protein
MAIKTTTQECWALIIIAGYGATPATMPFDSEEAARTFATAYIAGFGGPEKSHHVLLVDGTVTKLEAPKPETAF